MLKLHPEMSIFVIRAAPVEKMDTYFLFNQVEGTKLQYKYAA